MRISYNWLNDYVDLSSQTPEKLAEALTLQVAEVEGLERIGGEFADIVTAKIREVKPHPNADKLRLVPVDLGENKIREVVCGAPNVATNQTIAFIEVGGKLPDGSILKKANIRGVESMGMILSARELGLSEEHEGILVLENSIPAGKSFAETYGLADWVFIVDNKSLTHRPDLWGHYGFARELAVILGQTILSYPNYTLPTDTEEPKVKLEIDIQDKVLCPRYSAAVIENITIGPSPQWMQHRLRACGVRPINNIVDISNYVMLELGQPTHSFDWREISGGKIVVRRAQKDEEFITLDQKKHSLCENHLLICDRDRPVALAGVMGGLNSEVKSDTTTVLIESANFAPTHIRRTANFLGLRTESSNRFEKSLDPAMTTLAIARIVALIRECCPDARLVSPLVDANYWDEKIISIPVNLARLADRLGTVVEKEKTLSIFRGLHFGVEPLNDEEVKLHVPSFRATKDISIFEDIVEEVGRIIQFGTIIPVAPLVTMEPVPLDSLLAMERKARSILSQGLGFTEVFSYAFTNGAQWEELSLDPELLIKIANPISAEHTHLRQSLVPSLIAQAAKNLANVECVSLYEMGRGFFAEGKKESPFLFKGPHIKEMPYEARFLSGVVVAQAGKGASHSDQGQSFYAAKWALEELFKKFGWGNLNVCADPSSLIPFLHPSRAGKIVRDEITLGYLGQIHPALLAKLQINRAISAFEIDLNALLQFAEGPKPFKELPKFPATLFDLSIVVPKKEFSKRVADIILEANPKLVEDVELFDTYIGEQLPKDTKSLSFRVSLRSASKTLGTKEVDYVQNAIIKNLSESGFELRK